MTGGWAGATVPRPVASARGDVTMARSVAGLQTGLLEATRQDAVAEAGRRGHTLGRFAYTDELGHKKGAGRDRGRATCTRCGRGVVITPYRVEGIALDEECDKAPAAAWLRETIARHDGERVPVPLSPLAVATILGCLDAATKAIRENPLYALGYEPTRGQGDEALAKIRRARIEVLECRK